MNKKTAKIFLITISAAILICSIAAVFYVKSIKIYGNFSIYITDNGEYITDRFQIKGLTVFDREQILSGSDTILINSDKWWFKELHIIPLENSKANNAEIIITNENGKILLHEKLNNSNIFKIAELNYNHNFFSKIAEIDFYRTHAKRFSIKILIIKSLQLFLVFILGLTILLLLIFSREKYPSVFLSILLSGITISFIIILYHALWLNTIFVYTGIFAIICFLLLVLLILFVGISNKNRNKNRAILITTYLSFFLIILELYLRLFQINETSFELRNGYFENRYYSLIKGTDFNRPINAVVNFSSDEFNYERSTNSLGLSDREPPNQKNKNDFLIMALGDSFTEGGGAHADSTWMKFLERKISSQDTINYIFINAGMSSSDPIYQYFFFEKYLLHYKPDLVISTYGYDVDEVIVRGGRERFEKATSIDKYILSEKLYSLSFIYRYIIHDILKLNSLFFKPKDFEDRKKTAIMQIKENILYFDSLAKKNDFKLLIIFHPMKEEIIDGHYTDWDNVILFVNENNISNLDLLKYFINQEIITEQNYTHYYWKIDGHHNSKGYKAFAEGIYKKLKDDKLLPHFNE